jgi:acetyl-CoA C-acetyltransferase
VKRNGPILEVTINRPEARNSLTPEANFELEHIFNLFEKDRTIWAAILTGAGEKAFSAGNDLKYTASGKQMWVPETGFAGLTHRKNRTKPIIAAVNGFAYGGGLEIALACDIIVADETAKFALPEVKVGLIAAAGGIFRLPKAIPPHIAKDMILTGRAMDMHEAAAHGLVNYTAAKGEVMSKAREIAEQLCSVSPTAVAASMAMMNAGADCADPLEALQQSSDSILEVVASEDLQIGIMAFLTKQKPKWKNK